MALDLRYIRFFSQIGIEDIPHVGGKNASLGEMYRALAGAGVRVPNGFAITAEAYRMVLEEAGAWPSLKDALSGLDPKNVEDLAKRAARAREIVQNAVLPSALVQEIRGAYQSLVDEYGASLTLAVRSSATAEDLPTASFAGQHESYLNIAGEAALLDAIRRCFASLFTDRAIRYRIDNGFDHFKVYNSVGVMKMVRSDLATSGVIFTLDTETGFQDVVFLTGAYGLGENVVQGTVDPDEFYVFKPLFRAGKRVVLKRSLGGKEMRMIYGGSGRETTRNLPTDPKERARFCLSDAEVLTLAGQAIAIEDHYSAKAGTHRPMDIEWAKDGIDGKLYIVQARAETVASRKDRNALEDYRLVQHLGAAARDRPRRRSQDRDGPCPRHHAAGRSPGFRAGRNSRRRYDLARLGHGDAGGGRHRDEPRRTHLPCGDRRARTWHSRRRRHRNGDRARSRPASRSPSSVRKAKSARSIKARSPSPWSAPISRAWRGRRPKSC